MTLSLPFVSERQAWFGNAIAASISPCPISIGENQGMLYWQIHPSSFKPIIVIDLALDGVPAMLSMDADPTHDLLSIPITGDELQKLPEAFQAGLFEAALSELLQNCRTASGLTIEATALRHLAAHSSVDHTEILPRGLRQDQEPNSKAGADTPLNPNHLVNLGWCFVDASGQPRLAGCLKVMPQIADRIAQQLAATGVNNNALAVGRLPLAPLIAIGSSELSRQDIQGIETGDVVMVQHHRWGQSLVTIIIGDELRYVASVDDGELTVMSREGAGLVDEFDEAQPEQEALTDLNDLVLPVTFDLGRLELSVGELGQVAEGYLFNLQRPLESQVSLRVNGRLIGRGELVDIEGNLGVRVTEIVANNNG